jgi:hypothetical protein
MRCHQRAGFALEPALHATGRLRRSSVPPVVGVRAGDVDDLDLVAHIDRVQRGGAHGPDLELLLSLGAQLYVVNNDVRRGRISMVRTVDSYDAWTRCRLPRARYPPDCTAEC